MPTEHWGALSDDEDSNPWMPERCVPTSSKKPKLDELDQLDQLLPMDENVIIELNCSLITQTIEVMKQTEMLQSLIDTYSNKNGNSNYLLNPCQMIPEVDFPPENVADLVNESKFQKPIWFIRTEDTSYSRGEPEEVPEISSNCARHILRKVMCGLLRLAGFTDCSETAVLLLTDATEEFLRGFISEYRRRCDNNAKLKKSTKMQLLPLEQASFALTGTSVTQVHNYYKHKVITRNRAEIAEFNGVLQEYYKLMKESQNSMIKHQQHNDFNGGDYLTFELQPGDDGGNSTTGSNSMGIVGEMTMQELGGGSTSSSISLSTMSNGQSQIISANGNAVSYSLQDGQSSTPNATLTSSSSYQSYE
ncbi:uncharacterized protein LOC108605849 isoform X2 [Drosophila busckii]|uniref:uncharacterized protein LOC108605849 isoform X2 n=1 Tax=Drosophila busckii TaxID=30019 RepID=UPI00083EE810|nr:uncharacterized protein LOC108605849 isoform X2 [Drosophila busckii]